MTKGNIFDAVQTNAQQSEGLKTLKQTKISLTQERRSKNLAFTVTPTEKLDIRQHASSYERNVEERVTVSDITREMWLLLTGKPTDNAQLREQIENTLKS